MKVAAGSFEQDGVPYSRQAHFEDIYNKYWSKLYLSAYSILLDQQASEDIVQDIMVELWHKRDLDAIQSIPAYLHAAVRYQVFKVIRAGKVTIRLPEEIELATSRIELEDQLDSKDLYTLLDHYIEELPEKCREVFILSRKHYLSIKEISALLEISTKTVENHLTNALRKLRLHTGDFLCWVLITLPFLWK